MPAHGWPQRCRRALARQQFLHPFDHLLRLEGFRKHAVTAGGRGFHLVHGLERTGQQENGNVRQARRLFDVIGHLVAVLAGHTDIGQDNIGRRGLEMGNRLVAVADGDDLDVLVGKRQFDDALDGDAVVSQKKGVRHLGSIGGKRVREQSLAGRIL